MRKTIKKKCGVKYYIKVMFIDDEVTLKLIYRKNVTESKRTACGTNRIRSPVS